MNKSREKSHLESKKFIAWFVSEMTWKAILIVALVVWREDLLRASAGAWWFLMSIVVTAGFIGVGFILGQAALDKYVRVAEIAADTVRPNNTGGNPEPTDPKVTS